jgi:pimeloyl-ACP methyl ester carboxylesterase
MYTERYGEGEKVIFVHGSGWNTNMWNNQRDYLQSFMEVILVDLPGHGKSPGTGCDSIEEYSDAVYGMIGDLDIGKCFVAGHSLGGAIALLLSLAHAEVIKGIILIGTGAKLRVHPSILDNIITDKEKTVRNIGALAFSINVSSALRDQAFDETMKCKSEVIHKDFRACDRFSVMESVSSLSVPALILCGTDDVLTLPKYSAYLNEAIRGSRLVFIEDAGHMVMMEKPMEVNREIEKFVRGK